MILNGRSTINAARTLTCQGTGRIVNNGNLTIHNSNGVNVPLTVYFGNNIENNGHIGFSSSGTVTFAGIIESSGKIFGDEIDLLKFESVNPLLPLTLTAKQSTCIVSSGASLAISSSSSTKELISEKDSSVFLYPDDTADSQFAVKNIIIDGTLHTLSHIVTEFCLLQGGTIKGHRSSNVSLSCKDLELADIGDVNFEYISIETGNMTIISHTTFLKGTILHILSGLTSGQDLNIIFSFNSALVLESNCVASFWHSVHMSLSDISNGLVKNYGFIGIYEDVSLTVPIINEGTIEVASSKHIIFYQHDFGKTTTATFRLEQFSVVEFIGSGDLSLSSSSILSDFTIIYIKSGRIFIPSDIMSNTTLSVSGGSLHLLSGSFDKPTFRVFSGHLSADDTVQISNLELHGGVVNLTNASIAELTCFTGRLIGIGIDINNLIVDGECELISGSFYITETYQMTSPFSKVLKLLENAEVVFEKNSTSHLTRALLDGDDSGKIHFLGYLEVSVYVEVSKIMEVYVSGEIHGNAASSFQCKDSSTVIGQGAIFSFPNGSLDVTATCTMEISSTQFTLHSVKVTGIITLLGMNY